MEIGLAREPLFRKIPMNISKLDYNIHLLNTPSGGGLGTLVITILKTLGSLTWSRDLWMSLIQPSKDG
jgi:hypothetical protein